VLEAWTLPFFQRGIVEVLLLAGLSGLLGTWIVLRGLSFFAHAAGTATVPGLVLADGLAFSPLLGALGASLLAAAGLGLLAGRRSVGTDSATALVLAGALALGVILASDVFGSQGSIDRLLFGSLLAIGPPELAMAAGALAGAAVVGLIIGGRWLGNGFTGQPAFSGRGYDAALIVLVAVAVVAALGAVGALMTGAILVVPAATARLFTDRLPSWQLATAALAAAEGVIGMTLAYQLNVPPGAAIAALAGAVFALVVAARWLGTRIGPRAPLGIAGALALVLAMAGCGQGGDGASDDRVVVSATTTQVGDLVRQVGGDSVTVNQILKPNSEAHDYEPRPADVAEVADAKVVFASGLGLDEWARKLVEESGSKATVVDLGRDLPVTHASGEDGHSHGEEGHSDEKAASGEDGHSHGEEGHSDEKADSGEDGDSHGDSGVDPHWWHDAENLEAATTRIEKALIAADPAARKQIEANADAYRARIRKVDAEIRACLDKVPEKDRVIVTDHDAFVYFTERYGVRSVGAVFPSTSTQGQASAGEVAELEKTIREEKVKAVFPESSLNPALAEQIAGDTGASSQYTLYGDTLGPSDGPEGSVLGAAAANAEAVAAGTSGGSVRCSITS
jgi:ABC-type Zn uptake system ZnuABC Zn-binding protein ZnuA/ABC-type Mn2+/Zn2+ transport system permease subunit